MMTIFVSSREEGVEKAKQILYEKIDRRTVLFLSGGQSPKPLYEVLAKEKKIFPIAAAMIDERYGPVMHEKSNEKMIKSTGLLSYFKKKHIAWHPILQKGLSREETAEQYDETVRKLFFQLPKSVAVMSIGADGHTAGIRPMLPIPAYRPPLPRGDQRRDAGRDFIIPSETVSQNVEEPFGQGYKTLSGSGMVGEYNDTTGPFGERITLTFQALSMIDYFLLWVFGSEKKKALRKMFEKGSEQEVPARFYIREEISERTVLITDQSF